MEDKDSTAVDDATDRAEAIEGIRRGLESAARGEGRPAGEVFAELQAKYGLTDSP